MKRTIPIIACGLFALSCQQSQKGYTLKGTLGNVADSTKVYLVWFDQDKTMVRDSTYVVNNSFEFTGEREEPASAFIVVNHDGDVSPKPPYYYDDALPLYIENGEITVSSPDSVKNATVTGSPASEQMKAWEERTQELTDQMDALMADYREAYVDGKADEAYMERFEERYENLTERRKEEILRFINDNPGSYYALDKLYPDYIGHAPDGDHAESIFLLFTEEVRNTKLGEARAKKIEAWKSTAVGATAPEFTQNDPSGKAVSLSDFRGRYVLLDFWASWCGPCRRENPHVVAAFNAYKDKGFTVFGVSLDNPDGRDAWLQAIEDDNLEWTQVSDLKGWKNEAAQLYAVSSIPSNFLIDPEGVIVERNLRGDALTEALAKYLD